jgi:hypothetical protein
MFGFGEGMDDAVELGTVLGKILGFSLSGNDGTTLGIAEGEWLGKLLVFMSPGNVLGKGKVPSGEVDGGVAWMVGISSCFAKVGSGRRSIGLNLS